MMEGRKEGPAWGVMLPGHSNAPPIIMTWGQRRKEGSQGRKGIKEGSQGRKEEVKEGSQGRKEVKKGRKAGSQGRKEGRKSRKQGKEGR
jgi:hypothetical protein